MEREDRERRPIGRGAQRRALGPTLALILALACASPAGAQQAPAGAASVDQTYEDLSRARAEHAPAGEFERVLELARAAARAGGPEARLRVELELAGWQIETHRPDEARATLDRAEAAATGSERLGAELDYLRLVLARQSGDLDRVTREHERALARLAPWLEQERSDPELRRRWLGYHLELAARLESELGRARLDAGLPELAAEACGREDERARALPEEFEAERAAALVRNAQDGVRLALGTERFARARRACDEVLDGRLALLEEERAGFEIARAVARSEEARPAAPGALADELARLALAPETAPADRALAELVCVDLALRAHDPAEVHAHLGRFELAVAQAREQSLEHSLAELEARSAAFAVRLALEEHAPLPELESARDRLAQRFGAILADWEGRALRPGGVGFLYWGTQRLCLSELMCAELALAPGEVGARAALEHLVRAQRVGTLARALLADGQPDAGALPEARTGGGWLVLFPAMQRSHLFLIEGQRVEHVELAARDVLVRASQALLDELQRAPAPGDPQRLARLIGLADGLSELVLRGPARERLRSWRRVRVVGADLCQGLPVECLRLDGQWLGLARAVSHLPSLPVAAALARRAAARTDGRAALDFVLLAEPELSDAVRTRWPRQLSIPLAADDERALLRPFADGRARVLRGPAASAAALGAPEIAGCRVLGLLTHGVQAAGCERGARLLLAPGAEDDGELSCERVEALERTPRVVLLCACSSAAGPQRLGDDTGAHLGASFLRRGTDVVVVSRGDVSYRAMVALLEAFGRASSAGAEPDEALRLARVEVARTPGLEDPFYFGQVSLLGLGDQRVFDGPPAGAAVQLGTRALLLAGLLLLVLLAPIAVWLRRRRPQIGEPHQPE